ncbi:hypothetical protein [Paludisphaera sp.]|uniref:hypothetical protein n=1 Tax=Paludisphaera sp. TaxID=2017432 RepID=UPI00301E29F7
MKRRSRKWSGPAIDRLEARRTPSHAGAGLSGMSPPADFPAFARPQLTASPADGSTINVADAPSTLVLHMGGPAEFLWFDASVELRRVAPDGSEVTVVEANRWAPASIAGETVTLALPSRLESGRYRIVVLGGTGLASTYAPGRWDPAGDHAIAEFEVKAEAVATDLGDVGPEIRAVAGSLDGMAAADSYKIRLHDGPGLWRLGLQLDADRMGSGLIAGLTVLDANGRRVAEVSAWPGLPTDHPDDPYLFAALAPGEYTVVVSRAAGAPGGAYRLNLVASPVVSQTRVSSFVLERSGAGPSGFQITFSSPIDPARLRPDAIAVVDAFGAIHAARLVSVDEGLTAARFEFDAPLPAGEYRLLVAGDRPLADLIGRPPVAEGLPAGTLASWSVSSVEAGAGLAPPRSGLIAAGRFDLPPGETLEIPITLRDGESLILASILDSGGMRVEVLGGPDGPIVVSDGIGSYSGESWINPGAGNFVIRIVAVGERPLAGSWKLNEATTPAAWLIARAVGSRGAIGLGMGEEASTPQSPAPVAKPAVPALDTAAAATGAGRSALGPSPWAYGAGSKPVGRPTPTGDVVAPVGPLGPPTIGASMSVAWAGEDDLASGLGPILITPSRADDAPQKAIVPRDDMVALAAAESAPDADSDALDRAERVADAILGRLQWLVEGPAPAADGDAVPPTDAGAQAQVQAGDPDADAELNGSGGRVQRSALELPFTVLFITASTFHLRRASRRWWSKRKIAREAAAAAAAVSAPFKPLLRGPRFMSRAASRPRAAGPRHG